MHLTALRAAGDAGAVSSQQEILRLSTRLTRAWGFAAAVLAIWAVVSDAAEFGAKVGVTTSTHRTDVEFIEMDYRTGFRANFFGRWTVLPEIKLNAELGYTQRGATNVHYPGERVIFLPAPAGDRSSSHLLQYLTVPLTADLELPIGSVGVFAGGGPRADVLLSATKTSEATFDAFGSRYDQFNPLVFGFVASAGLRFPRYGLSLEVQYNRDLTDSYDAPSSLRNESFDFLVGYGF